MLRSRSASSIGSTHSLTMSWATSVAHLSCRGGSHVEGALASAETVISSRGTSLFREKTAIFLRRTKLFREKTVSPEQESILVSEIPGIGNA